MTGTSPRASGLYPDFGGDKIMKLIDFAERKSPRDRLNAFAITRADQPRYVERTHSAPRLASQSIQKRLSSRNS